MNPKSLTTYQLLQKCQAELLTIGNKMSDNYFKIQDIGDNIPGSVMIQDLEHKCNLYMNSTGCKLLNSNSEKIYALDSDYITFYFPEHEMTKIWVKLYRLISKNDYSALCSFYHGVRVFSNKAEYTPFYTTSKLFSSETNQSSTYLIHVAFHAETLAKASLHLTELAGESSFVIKNYYKYSLLSRREKEILTLIADGNTSGQISDRLYISIHTVNNHRKSILKKIENNSISYLIRFAISFGMI